MDDSTPTTPDTPRTKLDSYINTLTGLGTLKDKGQFGGFQRRTKLQTSILDSMYEQDAIAARIVDRVVDDATREDIFLTDTDKKFDFASIQSQLEDLDAVNALGDAWRWARLYGGALAIPIVNDGNKMDEPLELDKATKISSIQVIESPFILPVQFNPGLGARAFRNPEFYDIVVPFGSKATRKIHRSRVIRFDGLKIPPTRTIENNGWGPSVLDRVFTELDQLGQAMGYAKNILQEISVMAMKLEGLRKMIVGGEDSKQEARVIFETIKWGIDNLHMLVLDEKDEYEEVSRSVAGLKELLDEFIDAVVRATDMPRTIILGEQPAGLSGNADSEIRAWFDFVAAQQKFILTRPINKLLTIIFAIRSNAGEPVPTEWKINYTPLWQPTRLEQSETLMNLSNSAVNLITLGIGSPEQFEIKLTTEGLLPEIETPADNGES